jgi:hypothetical protein
MKKKIREFLERTHKLSFRLLLSDYEWKKKYCPEVYSWLFELTDEERKEIIKKGKEHCDKVWKLAEQNKRTELEQPKGSIVLSNIDYQLAEEQLKKAGE